MNISDAIEFLRDEAMTEEKFWGMLAMGDDDEVLDFGRDYCKEG